MTIEVATAKEAIEVVLATRGITKYAIAKRIGRTPSMINRYLEGVNASPEVADRILVNFGISITETRNPGRLPNEP